MSVRIGISLIAWQNDDLPDLTAAFSTEQAMEDAGRIGYVGVERGRRMPADTEGLRRIYERLFTRFLQYDYLDAANYLVEQPPSPALDTALGRAVPRATLLVALIGRCGAPPGIRTQNQLIKSQLLCR